MRSVLALVLCAALFLGGCATTALPPELHPSTPESTQGTYSTETTPLMTTPAPTEPQTETIDWADHPLLAMLPVLGDPNGWQLQSSRSYPDNYVAIYAPDLSPQQVRDYITQLESLGFTQDSQLVSDVQWYEALGVNYINQESLYYNVYNSDYVAVEINLYCMSGPWDDPQLYECCLYVHAPPSLEPPADSQLDTDAWESNSARALLPAPPTQRRTTGLSNAQSEWEFTWVELYDLSQTQAMDYAQTLMAAGFDWHIYECITASGYRFYGENREGVWVQLDFDQRVAQQPLMLRIYLQENHDPSAWNKWIWTDQGMPQPPDGQRWHYKIRYALPILYMPEMDREGMEEYRRLIKRHAQEQGYTVRIDHEKERPQEQYYQFQLSVTESVNGKNEMRAGWFFVYNGNDPDSPCQLWKTPRWN